METALLLETYLKQLRLPTCLRHDRKIAEEAAGANLGYAHFRLALAEQEVAQREQNRQAQLIRAARFPVLKELADVDFSCLSSVHKPQVLDLARGDLHPEGGTDPHDRQPGPGENAHGHRLGQ